MELTARKKEILKVVIEHYISTAEPVGSKTIAEEMTSKVSSATIRNELADLVDLEKERARLEKELANAAKQLQAQIGKLSNQNFVTRAPEAVVNAEREKQAKLEALIENLKLNLSHLS